MGRNKIIQHGIICRIQAKAAIARELTGANMVCETSLVYGTKNMEETFDAIDGLGRQWLSRWSQGAQSGILRLLGQEQQVLEVDCTGFFVYGIVRNERCKKALEKYTEGCGTLEGGLEEYRDSRFMNWFRREERSAVQACMAIIKKIRKGDEESEKAFLSIASSGYKRLRQRMKRMKYQGENADLELQQDDFILTLSSYVIAMMMAEELGIVMAEDLIYYLRISILEEYGRTMVAPWTEPEITPQGRAAFRIMSQRYICGHYAKCYFEGPEKTIEYGDWKNEGMAGEERNEQLSIQRLFSIFRLDVRMIQGIVLSQKEQQQIFSLAPGLKWEEYEGALLIATLCVYIRQLHDYEPDQNGMKILIGEMEKRLADEKRKKEELRRELECIKESEEKTREELTCVLERLRRREESWEVQKRRQRQMARELEEIRKYLYQESLEADCDAGDEWKKELKNSRVLVIGGHKSWQLGMRARFPDWQFFEAGKNNYNSGSIRGKDLIIVNTSMLKHSSYYRIVAERSENQKILYVNGNNPDRCIEELRRQLMR